MQPVLSISRTIRPDRVSNPVAIYLATAASTVTVIVWSLYASGWRLGSPVVVAGLAAVGLLAERANVSVGERVVVSVSLLPALFGAVLLGPLAAMTIYATSAFGLAFPTTGRVTYALNRALIGATAGIAAASVVHMFQSRVGAAVAAAGAGAVCAGITDVALTSATFRVRGNRDWMRLVRDLLPMVLAASPFYASVVALLELGYKAVSPWTLPLFFAPALAAQRFFVLYQDQRRLTGDLVDANAALVDANAALERANLSFASGLVAVLDARDQYTAGHSAAVAIYARDIAARMDLPLEQQELAHVCGLVHDIGKVGLAAGLLEKPGALTLDERREMERHSEIGERILAKVDTYSEIAPVVRHHHERVDGMGYPDGLVGEKIPLISRIICVADAYNAMTSNRPYRDAMPSRVARLRLAQAAETQFDTSVLAAFEAILASSSEDYQDGKFGQYALAGRSHENPDSAYAELVSLSA
jgi:putative nucleotidyltransferase with HDIG domain